MSSCPACATPADAGFRYCPACGTDLDLPENPTGTAPVRSPAPPASPRVTPGSNGAGRGAPARERFVPGTILANRYRIVGLLGRGGMGEVYRADDLKLEQPVALKFLTRSLEKDPALVERLYAEVRTARQVSHPAVCRVWDIGEGTVDFHLEYGEWIRLFRANGLVVDDLVELRAPKHARTTHGWDVKWARRWPAEQIWCVRKA